jgi:hypothetical protein
MWSRCDCYRRLHPNPEEVLGNNNALKQWRLDIATAMWDDYVIYANEAGYDSEEEDEDI